MESYTIGQVCRLLDVKPHVLRYWEQEVSLLAPRKTATGRRLYSDHDMQVLYRLRYLLYEKRYTIEGARKQIWAELNTANLNLKSRIAAVRSDLLAALACLRRQQVVIETKLKGV